jgi:hypothetical protein
VASSNANAYHTGFAIFRSVNNAGAPTADSVHVLAGFVSGTAGTYPGTSGLVGYMSCIAYNTSTLYQSGVTPTPNFTPSPDKWYSSAPLGCTTTQVAGVGQVFPAYQLKPTTSAPPYGLTNQVVLIPNTSELPLNTTFVSTVLGTLSLTYLSAGPVLDVPNLPNFGYLWQ